MTQHPILTLLKLWHRRIRTRRQLLDLPAHLLRDIGIDAEARERECAQWPWQSQHVQADDAKENGRRLRAPVVHVAMSDRF